MNKKKHAKVVFMALCGVLGLNSCRPVEAPIPIDGNHHPINPKESSIIPVAVSVGKSYENDESETSGKDNQQKIDLIFRPKEFKGALEIRRLDDHQSDEELEYGVHYRVLAYQKMGSNFTLYKTEDFVYGGEKKLELDKAQRYKLIIYSFGSTSEIPEPSNKDNIEKVSIDYTEAKTLLYEIKDDYVATEGLKLKLKNQLTGIKVVLDASDYFGGGVEGRMKDIVDAKITYKGVSRAIFNLGNGKSDMKSSGKNTIKLNFKGFESVKESDWTYIMLPKDEKVTFEARVSMDKPMDGADLGKIKTTIPVERNTRQTIKISQQLCGALLRDNGKKWKQFMCYDLGAYGGGYYPTANPLKYDANHMTALHGAKFQWGYPNNKSRMTDAFTDLQPVNNGILHDTYGKDPIKERDRYKNESWNDIGSPCPEGYELPTRKDLSKLAEYNFTGIELYYAKDNGGNYNFKAGYLLDKEKGTLYLPASGQRDWRDGDIHWHGLRVYLWSSDTAVDAYDSHLYPGKYAYGLMIGDDVNRRNEKDRKVTGLTKNGYYMPIRCVKKYND